MRRFACRVALLACSVALAAALASCGGGGGGSASGGGGGDGTGSTSIGGYVVKGSVAGATVQLQTVAAGGARTTLGQGVTGADGAYQLTVVPLAGSVLLITASGGTYVDEATNSSTGLTTPLRALVVWSGSPMRVSPTPYSEIAVRSIERAAVPDWSAASTHAANAAVADWLGVADTLDFRPVDLRGTVDPTGLSDQDFGLSLYAGAFATFAHRLDANPATSLSGGLDNLYYLVFVDSEDDRLFPAFVSGLSDFVDLTSLPDDAKALLKSALIFGSTMALPADQLRKGLPHGISSGSTTAPMPDDAFALLGYPGGHTAFNKRGALVGYTTAADTPDWQEAYTSSVAEVFGDGDVGIGRWNGGAVITTTRTGDTYTPSIAFLPYDSLPYAVARPPTAVPLCGLRRLALTANTDPSLLSEAVGLQRAIVGLTPDSSIGLQYLDGFYVGADIGAQLADGSVVRFRSPGGTAEPWATVRPVTDGGVALQPVDPAGPLAGQTMGLTALISGAGAGKAAVRLDLDSTSMTAVFVDPADQPGSIGCAMPGAPGAGISPHPVDGDMFVFLPLGQDDTFRGAEVGATFGPSGELQSALSASISGPAYELAGNADASIGRIGSSMLVNNVVVTRSEPYAVVRPGVVAQSSGTVIYDLVAATSGLVERGGSGAEVPPGAVSAATLQITFGEYPLGTPSPFYGTAVFHVEGTVGDVGFVVTSDVDHPATPMTGRVDSPIFQGDAFKGAVTAPTGDYAAVEYQANAGGVPVNGTLLFRKRP